MPRFKVTYDIVTPESAEHGDAEELGFISEDSSLRDAIHDLFETRTSRVSGLETAEADSSTVRVINGMEFETGACESRYLHIPETVTESSRRRILALCDECAGFTIHRT